MNNYLVKSSWSSLAVVVGAAVVLNGCAAYDEAIEDQKVAYKRAEKREVGLEVPPDLTAQDPDEQFTIPEGQPGATVSASDYYSGRRVGSGPVARAQVTTEPVLVSPEDAEIRRVGSTRSILIQRPPAQVYGELRKFWRETGFDLVKDQPEIGVMETNWLENRAAIPVDGVRSVIGRFFDGVYSSNMRDKYRTRVEPIGKNATEVFITHRGMEEVYTDQNQTNLVWQTRPSDPELEAELSNRFLAFMVGGNAAVVAVNTEGQPVAQQPATPRSNVEQPLMTLNRSPVGTNITLAEDFPLAWRRVGFGLDKSGFIVEDRDRSNGTYYVRYSPDSAANPDKKRSIFYDLFDFGDSDSLQAEMRLQVAVVAMSNSATQVSFLSEQGKEVKPKVSEEASTILIKAMGGDVDTVNTTGTPAPVVAAPAKADPQFDPNAFKALPAGAKPLVSLNKSSDGTTMNVGESFSRAWDRVGYALGQSGFIVEDGTKVGGKFFVRYAPEAIANPDKRRSVLLDLFDFGEPEELREEMRLQVSVTAQASQSTKVEFFNEKGQPVKPKVSDQAANLLAEQLR